jgi:hypothetical protein
MAKGSKRWAAVAKVSQRRGADLSRWEGRRAGGVAWGGCQGAEEEGEGVCCHGEGEVVTSLLPSEPERKKYLYIKEKLALTEERKSARNCVKISKCILTENFISEPWYVPVCTKKTA